MAIKENALPLGASSGSGSYIRTVSSGGESQRTSFDVVKGAMNADIETALENEVSAREDADTALRGEITDAVAAEATARDQAIAAAIATEVTDRNAAIAEAQDETEQAISTAISGEVTARNQAIASAIQTETADRTAAIQAAIADEVTNRNAAIASAIDDEETARNTAISEAVAAEAQAREAADEELNQSKANTDGNYPDMTVGNADQLISSIYTEDQTPYIFRQSGGGLSIGNREIDKIVGGTIAWNQLVENGNFADASGWQNTGGGGVSFSVSNNTGKLTIIDNTNANRPNLYRGTIRPTIGHKYIFICDQKITTQKSFASSYFALLFGELISLSNNITTNEWVRYEKVLSLSNVTYDTFNLYLSPLQTDFNIGDTIEYRNVQLVDLTQMFGSAIADYIYNLEQATAGAGVAYFKKLFPKPYYAYNAGELMSVQAASHDMVGFNQFDKDTAVAYNAYLQNWSAGVYRWIQYSDSRSFAIRCLPNTTYCAYMNGLTPQILRLCSIAEENLPTNPTGGGWYIPCDGEAITSSNGLCTYTTGANSKWLIVQISSQFVTDGRAYDNLCVNLSHNGSRNGEYEPYEKHSYELDSGLTLQGIPKLDASNNLYYDGDEYESDGSVNRRYGVVDLGTLNWTYSASETAFYCILAGMNRINGNLLCDGYTLNRRSISSISNMEFTNQSGSVDTLWFKNTAYTDAASFKAAMSGVMLVYELATPTEESAAPYTNPQTVSDWGTEEYVDAAVQEGDRDVAVPVGHVTDYLANLRDKLQNLPDAANADGTYLVQQTSGQMALLAYTPGVNVPAAPTTDGTYTLQAVVSGGVATYSWVSS